MKPIIGISCVSNNGAIGNHEDLIYQINYDMAHFRKTTTSTKDPNKTNAVVMGNRTYENIKIPLKNRTNYVITTNIISNSEYYNLYYYNNVITCLMDIQSNDNIETIFIIGGSTIFQYCFNLNLFNELILSYIHSPKNKKGDIFFPNINFNKYYIKNKSETVNVYDKNSERNQVYTIFYLKQYDTICQNFIKAMVT
jgi:dihydrofolate reductase